MSHFTHLNMRFTGFLVLFTRSWFSTIFPKRGCTLYIKLRSIHHFKGLDKRCVLYTVGSYTPKMMLCSCIENATCHQLDHFDCNKNAKRYWHVLNKTALWFILTRNNCNTTLMRIQILQHDCHISEVVFSNAWEKTATCSQTIAMRL